MGYNHLSRIVLNGFKSIRNCDLNLKELNILIGSNGAGKSNFINFFRLIQQLLDANLQIHISKQGGPDALLHFGRKQTDRLNAELFFENNSYKFSLEPTVDNKMTFTEEKLWCNDNGDTCVGTSHFETKIEYAKGKTGIYDCTVPIMKNWRVYHFHDTSETALVKRLHGINDNSYLRPDARNLAAYLYLLKNNHLEHYEKIVKTIKLAAPFFGDFFLRPNPDNKEQIELEWKEKGKDTPFKAHLLSDGTLRFICLTAMLLQPPQNQPETILIDEPELGLHPFAITILASMLRSISKTKQIIVATQSVELLNEFEPDDIIIADRTENGSYLHRINAEDLTEWLKQYFLKQIKLEI